LYSIEYSISASFFLKELKLILDLVEGFLEELKLILVVKGFLEELKLVLVLVEKFGHLDQQLWSQFKESGNTSNRNTFL
jgi:hypothetical protein